MAEYRLEMRGVVKQFPGVKALDHAQLKLRPGTVHALMGENGAGKSTLMKCMFCIYKMDEGEIYYEGKKVDINDPLQALSMGIALMVHPGLQPIPERSVAENIYIGRYPMKAAGRYRWSIMKRCMQTPKNCSKVRMISTPNSVWAISPFRRCSRLKLPRRFSADCRYDSGRTDLFFDGKRS